MAMESLISLNAYRAVTSGAVSGLQPSSRCSRLKRWVLFEMPASSATLIALSTVR